MRPRVCSDYFSLEDRVVFWCSGAYKKYPRSYGADHRVCGDHCPTSGHSGPRTPVNHLKVVLESCERGRFSQSRMRAAARRGPSASPHGPGMHPHTLLSRMPMRSVDAVVVLQLCSAATAPVSRVAAFGRAAPASSAARRRGGTRALRIPSEGRRLERWSRASRQTRRRHPYPRPHP